LYIDPQYFHNRDNYSNRNSNKNGREGKDKNENRDGNNKNISIDENDLSEGGSGNNCGNNIDGVTTTAATMMWYQLNTCKSPILTKQMNLMKAMSKSEFGRILQFLPLFPAVTMISSTCVRQQRFSMKLKAT
jgi:hypothetical protein